MSDLKDTPADESWVVYNPSAEVKAEADRLLRLSRMKSPDDED